METNLLDQSAAFNTIDHTILLKYFNISGIHTTALQWFFSYHSNRTQIVTVKKAVPCNCQEGSAPVPICCDLFWDPFSLFCILHPSLILSLVYFSFTSAYFKKKWVLSQFFCNAQFLLNQPQEVIFPLWEEHFSLFIFQDFYGFERVLTLLLLISCSLLWLKKEADDVHTLVDLKTGSEFSWVNTCGDTHKKRRKQNKIWRHKHSPQVTNFCVSVMCA